MLLLLWTTFLRLHTDSDQGRIGNSSCLKNASVFLVYGMAIGRKDSRPALRLVRSGKGGGAETKRKKKSKKTKETKTLVCKFSHFGNILGILITKKKPERGKAAPNPRLQHYNSPSIVRPRFGPQCIRHAEPRDVGYQWEFFVLQH